MMPPANLSPEYKRAEQAAMWTRTARAPRLPERDAAHDSETQGDGAFGADMKSRIRELTGEIGGTHAGAAHRHFACAVRPDGAAQIRLTGPPTGYPHMPRLAPAHPSLRIRRSDHEQEYGSKERAQEESW
jgi:hypothetical protein